MNYGDRVVVEAVVVGVYGDRIGLRTSSAMGTGGTGAKPGRNAPVYFIAPAVDVREAAPDGPTPAIQTAEREPTAPLFGGLE